MRLFTWEDYMEADVNKKDTKAMWKVCLVFLKRFLLNILNISNFKIQIGKSIKCTVDPESKKATVRVPDQYKRGRALNKRYI